MLALASRREVQEEWEFRGKPKTTPTGKWQYSELQRPGCLIRVIGGNAIIRRFGYLNRWLHLSTLRGFAAVLWSVRLATWRRH